MNNSDPLQRLLVDFFNLPPETSPSQITKQAIESWDSLAMVQLIAELQGAFAIEFDLDEIETLRSYEEISRALSRRGVWLPQNNRLARVNRVTQAQVREFLLTRYARAIRELGLDTAIITDDFDFLFREVIDSFGILEMIMSIEDEFQIKLDMASLDAEQITILGPLSRYVAEHGRANDLSASG